MSRWKIRDERIKGPATLEFKIKKDGTERVVPLNVDELGYFELTEVAPDGLYAVAKFIG